MKPVILFRGSLAEEGELEVAKKYFEVVDSRMMVPDDSLVIGRYSVLPFYQELEKDLNHIGSVLINAYYEHCWISKFDYYHDLKDFTFETWDEREFPYSNYQGPFVVKGKTNSFKHLWNKMMFANDREEAMAICRDLYKNQMIEDQGVIFRKYVPLKRFTTGFNGLPITNEWRFFFYKGRILSYGYYWANLAQNPEQYQLDKSGIGFAQKIADIAKEYSNFVVIDIAEKEEGGWILVELNDGQMSGLSMNDPHEMYGNLKKAIEEDMLDSGN